MAHIVSAQKVPSSTPAATAAAASPEFGNAAPANGAVGRHPPPFNLIGAAGASLQAPS